jgi:uncharacterized membrane protein
MALMRTEPEHLARLRKDGDNWSFGMYNCPADPRVVVRGREGIKYTVNFAHRAAAWTILIGSLAAVMLPVGIALTLKAAPWIVYLVTGVALVAVYAAHWWLARRES